MGDALRIETTEWRVARDGVTTFRTAPEAWEYAAHLAADGMTHLGRIRVQSRTVTITTGHWQDDTPETD